MDIRTVQRLLVTLLLLLAVPQTAYGQRTLLARFFNRVYSMFSNLIGGERLCPAGGGLIDLATLIPCGAELADCPANLACQRVTTLCRNTLIEVTTSVCMPVRRRGLRCDTHSECATGYCQPGTGTCEFQSCRPGELSVRLDSSCYRFQMDTGLSSYAAARRQCRSSERGLGRLVSINSAAEQEAVRWLLARALVTGIASRPVYLGLSDARREGRFEWQDGSPLLFSAWRGGTPVTAGNTADRDCAAMDPTDGTWAATDCAASRAAVCVTPLDRVSRLASSDAFNAALNGLLPSDFLGNGFTL
ncbi:uncharacterized protein LOC122363561 [Amphibalanus amphitrite]|uniref:uncharacterized protein LOC122363561 n=1 Tax=Amphibalanus amphitrite TaxID=1232801 RepID=UPI001C90CEEE|nr:uncharacterized protein LOC122363561 [Amphibalanus amphitrite]